MSTELDVEQGDTIIIRDDDKGDLEVKISAVCENYMGHYLYMTPNFMRNIWRDSGYNCIFYKLQTGLQKKRRDLEKRRLQCPGH